MDALGRAFCFPGIVPVKTYQEYQEYVARQEKIRKVAAWITGIFFVGIGGCVWWASTLPPVPPNPALDAQIDGQILSKDWLKHNLRDPDSLQIIEGKVISGDEKTGMVYAVEYRAKNGFGGYEVEVKLFRIQNNQILEVNDFHPPAQAVPATPGEPAPPPIPPTPSPEDAAKANSIIAVRNMFFQGKNIPFEVVSVTATENDMHAMNVSYPITAIIEFRYGGRTTTQSFGCAANGQVLFPLDTIDPRL